MEDHSKPPLKAERIRNHLNAATKEIKRASFLDQRASYNFHSRTSQTKSILETLCPLLLDLSYTCMQLLSIISGLTPVTLLTHADLKRIRRTEARNYDLLNLFEARYLLKQCALQHQTDVIPLIKVSQVPEHHAHSKRFNWLVTDVTSGIVESALVMRATAVKSLHVHFHPSVSIEYLSKLNKLDSACNNQRKESISDQHFLQYETFIQPKQLLDICPASEPSVWTCTSDRNKTFWIERSTLFHAAFCISHRNEVRPSTSNRFLQYRASVLLVSWLYRYTLKTLKVKTARLFRDHSINLRSVLKTGFWCGTSLTRIGGLFSSMLLKCVLTKSRKSRQGYLPFELIKNTSEAASVIALIRIRQDLIGSINDILLCFNQLRLSAPLTIEMELRQSTFDICNTRELVQGVHVQHTHCFNPGRKVSLASSLTNMIYSPIAGTIGTRGSSSHY